MSWKDWIPKCCRSRCCEDNEKKYLLQPSEPPVSCSEKLVLSTQSTSYSRYLFSLDSGKFIITVSPAVIIFALVKVANPNAALFFKLAAGVTALLGYGLNALERHISRPLPEANYVGEIIPNSQQKCSAIPVAQFALEGVVPGVTGILVTTINPMAGSAVSTGSLLLGRIERLIQNKRQNKKTKCDETPLVSPNPKDDTQIVSNTLINDAGVFNSAEPTPQTQDDSSQRIQNFSTLGIANARAFSNGTSLNSPSP